MSETRYLHMRHWDFWWSAYGIVSPAESAEFSITEDEAGERFYFHLELNTIPALKRLCLPGEFMEEDDPSYPLFLQKAEALYRGELDFFVGGLYYRHDTPDLAAYNCFQTNGTDIFQVKSPSRSPYYADLFIREEQGLSPACLLQWMERLAGPLFRRAFLWEIAQIPTREAALHSYLQDQH